MKLKTDDKLILAGAKLHPSDSDIQRMDELIASVTNWKSFTDMSIQNGVGPLIHKNFSLVKNLNLIPKETVSRFKSNYYRSLSRNMVLYEHFRNVVELFSNERISVIALKGIFLAEKIYKDIGLRQMSDIDLLVKEKDIEKCRKLLIDKGYKSFIVSKSELINELVPSKHLPPLVLNGVSIELHTKLHHDNLEFSINIEDYWNRSQQVMVSNKNVLALSIEDLIQYLCIHLHEHFNKANPQMTSFVDITEIIKKYYSKINWEYLLESSNTCNCSSIVFKYLLLSEKYFEVRIPENILQKLNAVIDSRTEKLFIHYLQHLRKEISSEIVSDSIVNYNNIKGFRNKIIYLIHDIFPSKKFMRKRYNLKNNYFLFWYYIIRMKTGVFRLFLQIFKKAVS